MTLRCLEPLALKFDGRAVQFEPGSVFTVTPARGRGSSRNSLPESKCSPSRSILPRNPCNQAGWSAIEINAGPCVEAVMTGSMGRWKHAGGTGRDGR